MAKRKNLIKGEVQAIPSGRREAITRLAREGAITPEQEMRLLDIPIVADPNIPGNEMWMVGGNVVSTHILRTNPHREHKLRLQQALDLLERGQLEDAAEVAGDAWVGIKAAADGD
jgi:hypothetical protein